MAVPPLHSFAAAKSEAKLGVLETVPVEEEEGGGKPSHQSLSFFRHFIH